MFNVKLQKNNKNTYLVYAAILRLFGASNNLDMGGWAGGGVGFVTSAHPEITL